MKAIMWMDGDLDLILENEEEVVRLKDKPLSAIIERNDGEITGTEVELSYHKSAKFTDNMRIKPDTAFLLTRTLSIALNDQSYSNLLPCNQDGKYVSRGYVSKTQYHKEISVYGPGEHASVR